MLYFNFNERPKELFDKIVEIRVLNSKVLLLESLIGSFKFDVGMAYDEPGEFAVMTIYMYLQQSSHCWFIFNKKKSVNF